ncbi:MAG TPA: cupin domain-containing protein, partial [Candidatus Spyradenecus faecavium]|nr:cupin domain-containing protein [Candidatus Spyradenecus faecavium]
GQLLICVSGEGRYQERASYARPGRVLLPGDVVEIAPGVEHWHGAAPGSWFQHLAISTNPGSNKTDWLEPVDEAVYRSVGAKREV